MAKDVFSKIIDNYYKFTVAEKKISDYVISQRKSVQYMSISELSEACGVGEATISRYCKTLGYKGYNAFKLAIANYSDNKADFAEINENSSVLEIAKNRSLVNISVIEQTMSLIDADAIQNASEILSKARKVFCMGQGGSSIMAQEAAHLFSMAFDNFYPVMESHMQMISAASLTKNDAVLYFSYSGATRDLEDAITVIKSKKAKVILITRFPKSPGAIKADIVISCGSKESPLQHGSVEARISQLFLLDVLYNEMCLQNVSQVEKHKNAVAQAVAIKHI